MERKHIEEVKGDFEKLKGFVGEQKYLKELKLSKTGMKLRHSQAGAVGAMGFIVHFLNYQGVDISLILLTYGIAEGNVKNLYEQEWAAAQRPVKKRDARRNCDMFIGYNLQRSEYEKRYPQATFPPVQNMECQAAPDAEKAIKTMIDKL